MLDYLNLPNVKTLRVHDVDEQEILVDVEGGVRPTRCPDVNCSGEHLVGNGSNTVVIRDIPRDGKWVWIRLRRRRVKCTICGRTASFHVNAFHPDRQMTIRLVLSIQQACLQETCASLSRRIGVDEGTIRDIAKAHIAHLDRSLSFGVPSVLGLDEFKIYGRPSAILTNIEARTIYDVLETRTAVHLRPALEQIAASGQLEVVVTDMFEAYLRLVGQIAPRTPVVIDRFHVVRMANDAMERVRRRVQVRLAPEERKRLKPSPSAMPGSARRRNSALPTRPRKRSIRYTTRPPAMRRSERSCCGGRRSPTRASATSCRPATPSAPIACRS